MNKYGLNYFNKINFVNYKKMSFVSVIIPTYNGSRYICETIDSVLLQTYKDYEIIVIDDGSTDQTEDTLKKYGSKIKYLYQRNQGPSAARNFGIKNSVGKYIGFLDHDDIWLPNKLEIQVKILDENHDLAFVCADAYCIDSFGKIIKLWKMHKRETFKNLYESNFVLNLTALVKKSCFNDIGGYDKKLFVCQDYDLWLRLAKKYKFKHLNYALAKYRKHENNISNNIELLAMDRIAIFKKKEFFNSTNLVKNRIKIAREFLIIAEYNYVKENYHKASIYFIKSVIYFPFVGFYYWPKETKNFRFTFLYRIIKVYFVILECIIRSLSIKCV